MNYLYNISRAFICNYKGLLGDIEKLDVSGDGSCIKSGANENGKPTCKCFKI